MVTGSFMKISPAQLAAISSQVAAERARQAQTQAQSQTLVKAPVKAETRDFVEIRPGNLVKAPNVERAPLDRAGAIAAAFRVPIQNMSTGEALSAASGRRQAMPIPAAWREAPLAGTRPVYQRPGLLLDIKV